MKNKKAIGRPAETKAGAWPGGRTTPPNAAPGLSESEVIALVEQCAGDLRGFFRRRGVAPADCEDLAQEALLVVWNLRERVREGKGRPFLFAIAYRRLLAYRRKQARRAAVLLPGPPEEGAEARPENGNAALQFMQLLDREATGRLGAALAQLPERQREVIQYVYFGGDTLADAANKLHIQAQTAGIHHQRALKRLRELLMEEGGGGMIPKGCDMIGKKIAEQIFKSAEFLNKFVRKNFSTADEISVRGLIQVGYGRRIFFATLSVFSIIFDIIK